MTRQIDGCCRDFSCVVCTKWMIPAAVNQTEMKMETSCANRIELDVLRMLRYCRISGTVISLRARRKRRPKHKTPSHDIEKKQKPTGRRLVRLSRSASVAMTIINDSKDSYRSTFGPNKSTQKKVVSWNSRRTSTSPAWTTICHWRRWTASEWGRRKINKFARHWLNDVIIENATLLLTLIKK